MRFRSQSFPSNSLAPVSVSYTILYASHFMSSPFTFQGKDLFDDKMKPSIYYGASGNHGVNYV